MITCPWMGGSGRLGNQLWQIASTVGIARRLNDEPRFPPWAYQKFFNVPDEWFVRRAEDLNDGTIVTEAGWRHLEHMDLRARDYLQDYSLWSKYADEFRVHFSPTIEAFSEIHRLGEAFFRLERPLLGVHVRRGDNATAHLRNEQGHHPLRPMSYYQHAIQQFPMCNSIAVFSDDIPWCRQAFSGFPMPQNKYFFEGGPARPKEHEPEYQTAPVLDWIDLLAFTFCDYYVLSNSTYSWWGAFLSGMPGNHIIYPDPWYGPKLPYIKASLMFPPSWRRLEHD